MQSTNNISCTTRVRRINTRLITDEDLTRILRENEIDAVLVVEQVGADYRIEGTGQLTGNTFRFAADQYTSNLYHCVRLYDAQSGRLAWIASAKTYESFRMTGTFTIYPGYSALMQSLATKVVAELRAAGLLGAASPRGCTHRD